MKKILMIIMLLIAFPICLADAEMNVTVVTDGNLDANIIEVADGDITTNIECYGATCTTNINGGIVNIPDNQTYEYNDYSSSYLTTLSKGSGLSLRGLISTLGKVVNDYVAGKKPTYSNNAWDFWSMVDYIFVSHKEYEPTRLNVNYLAEEIDAIKAENLLLRKYLNITWNSTMLECQTAIMQAERTGLNVVTENGFVVEMDRSGNMYCNNLTKFNTTIKGEGE